MDWEASTSAEIDQLLAAARDITNELVNVWNADAAEIDETKATTKLAVVLASEDPFTKDVVLATAIALLANERTSRRPS